MCRSLFSPVRLVVAGIAASGLFWGYGSAQAQPETPDAPPAVTASGDSLRRVLDDSSNVQVSIRVGDQDIVRIDVDDSSKKHADYIRFGESIHIPRDEHVSGDVVALGGNVIIEGKVDGDAVAIGGGVTLRRGAEVAGEVVSMAGVLTLEDSTSVGGDAVSVWGRLKAAPTAEVFGNVSDVGVGVKLPGTVTLFDHDKSFGHQFLQFLARVIWVLLLVGLGILAWSVFPRRMDRMAETLERRGLVTFLAGMAGWILWLPAFILVCITIVGIPVAILFAVFTPIMTLLGYLAVASIVGKRVGVKFFPGSESTTRILLAGVLALESGVLLGKLLGVVGSFLGILGTLLSVIGWSVIFVSATMGFGAFLMTRFRNQPEPPVESGYASPFVPPVPPRPSPPPSGVAS